MKKRRELNTAKGEGWTPENRVMGGGSKAKRNKIRHIKNSKPLIEENSSPQSSPNYTWAVFLFFSPNSSKNWKFLLIFRFVGALSGVAYIFTLPCVIHLMYLRSEGRLRWYSTLFHVILIVLGFANFFAQFATIGKKTEWLKIWVQSIQTPPLPLKFTLFSSLFCN